MRAHCEQSVVDFSHGWEPLSGFVGLEIKALSDDLDEAAHRGARTRLVRIAPGTRTGEVPLVHTYWEEVFLLSGDLNPLGEARVGASHTYSCRPPGTPHGPFETVNGCVLLETQYYVAGGPRGEKG